MEQDSMMKRAIGLQDEYGAEESFLVNSTLYLAIPQPGTRPTYAVLVKDLDGLYDNRWLKHPESRFETLGGARMAMLMDLGELVGE